MHVSVCIITFKRPGWLKRLLQALQSQETAGRFTYSIVVIDDDRERSALTVVDEIRPTSAIGLEYHVAGQQNLALARNAAVRNASGDLVAFIDDDEFPERDWLLNLFRTLQEHSVAGVLGPVVPHFEDTPPAWIVRSRVFERPRYATGRVLDWNETRTGNVLLDRRILRSEEDLFDPRFRTHGEDRDFFKRLMAKGHRFVWCDSAVAFETQPPNRLRRSYHVRRALLRGSISYSHATTKARDVVKSLVAATLYTLALPLLQLSGHHRFMKYFVKTCDHVGKLLAFSGYKVERHMTHL